MKPNMKKIITEKVMIISTAKVQQSNLGSVDVQ